MMYRCCCCPLPLSGSCQVKFQEHNKQECERGVIDFHHQQSRITWKGSLNERLFTSCWLRGMSMRDSPDMREKSTLHRGWYHSLCKRFSVLWGWRKWSDLSMDSTRAKTTWLWWLYFLWEATFSLSSSFLNFHAVVIHNLHCWHQLVRVQKW